MRKSIIVSICLVLAVLTASQAAFAAEFIFPEAKEEGNVVVSGAHRNLYTMGGNVSVDGTVTGDLYAAGGAVNITGSVEQDLVAAGGTVNITGIVGGDARLAGGNVNLVGKVGGDLLIAGGNLIISSQSEIAGDLIIGGGNVTVDAPVLGNIRAAGGNITINSRVVGEITARSGQLTFGPKAEALGKIYYKGHKDPIIKDGAKVAAIEFTKLEKRGMGKRFTGLMTLFALLHIAAMFIAGWLFLKFMRRRAEAINTLALREPWKNMGIGFLCAIIFPVVVILLFVTLVGFYVALITLFWFMAVILLTGLIASIFVGSMIIKQMRRDKTIPVMPNWKALLLGLVVLKILMIIPILGGIVVLLAWLVAFGAFLRVFKADLALQR